MSNPKRNILIIDDDDDDCIFLQESLYAVGLVDGVQYITETDEALRFLSETRSLPALIILDVNMPKMNGMELLAIIKRKYSVSVILYTTTCSDELILQSKKMGAIDCIKKGNCFADNLEFAKKVLEIVG
ncbi:MAG: response regulator [Chryseolinea sp.]